MTDSANSKRRLAYITSKVLNEIPFFTKNETSTSTSSYKEYKLLEGCCMMNFFLMIAVIVASLTGFNWLMGYRKNHIQIDLDERYIDYNEYVRALKSELRTQGREVDYLGDRKFKIDGKTYMFIERNVTMGGVPLQRTILKPVIS